MTKQVIQIGSTANDHRGDPLRTAFTKVNQNFTEVYDTLGIGSQFRAVAPPSSLTGAVGDQQQDVAFDSNYIYYCFADYAAAQPQPVIWKTTPWDAVGDTVHNNRYYVNPQIGSDEDATGSLHKPFQSVAGAQAQIEQDIDNGMPFGMTNPAFIVIAGNVEEDITLSRGHVYLVSDYGTQTMPVYIFGTITIDGSVSGTGAFEENHFAIDGLTIQPDPQKAGIYFTGENAQQLYITNTIFQASGNRTGSTVFTNTGGYNIFSDNTGVDGGQKSQIIGRLLNFNHSGTGDVYSVRLGETGIPSSVSIQFDNIQTGHTHQFIGVGDDCDVLISGALLVADGGVVAEVYGNGRLTCDNTLIVNTNLASSTVYGIELHDATSYVELHNCQINVLQTDGSSRAIKGATGSTVVYYSVTVGKNPIGGNLNALVDEGVNLIPLATIGNTSLDRLQSGDFELVLKTTGRLGGTIVHDGQADILELQSDLLMNRDRGFIVEVGRFPHAIDGDDWWFDVVVNKDDFIYGLGGADIDNRAMIVKIDHDGYLVWQRYYTVPVDLNRPVLTGADWDADGNLSVVGVGYDTVNDCQYSVRFEIDPDNGDVTGTPYMLRASDEIDPAAGTPNIYFNQIKFNATQSQYAIVGSKFGDQTNLNVTAASAISTTPGILKIPKATLVSAFGPVAPETNNTQWTIRGYGFTGVYQFTGVQLVTEDTVEYYNLTTDSSVDFTTLPEGQSWTIKYYDWENAYIETNNWSKLVDTGSDYDWFNSVVFDSAGNIYAGGGSSGPISGTSGYTSLLVSLTSTGTQRWAKRIEDNNGNGWNYIRGLAIDGNDNIYTVAEDDNSQTVIARIDAATGATEWIQTMTIDTGMSNHNDSRIIYCENDNTIVIAMEYNSISSLNDDFLVMKMDLSGVLLWALNVGSSGSDSVNWDFGQNFLSSDSNYIYIAGARYAEGFDDNAIIYAIPHEGAPSGWVGPHRVTTVEDYFLTFTSGTAADIDIGTLVVTSETNVADDTFATEAVDSNYEIHEMHLNGGTNRMKHVAEIQFSDGSGQSKSATDVPQTRIITANNSHTINESDRGGHILCKDFSGNVSVYVPTHAENPLPIGTVVTLVLDEFANGNRVYVTGNSNEGGTVYIRAVGQGNYTNRFWYVGGDDVQGLYTLMKIDRDVWILAGQTIVNAD